MIELSLKPSELIVELPNIFKAGLVPQILSSPGCGKSAIIKQFGMKHKLETTVYSLSQRMNVDISGYPMLNPDNYRMLFAPDETIPLDGDTLPNEKNGYLLFLDEANSCSRATAAAAYRLVLDRMVGKHRLHPKTLIALAGNLSTDRAITSDMGTAMQSRLVNIKMVVSLQDWINWAIKNNINQSIISFLKFKPNLLHNFDPAHLELNFPCPRTWGFVSRYIGSKPTSKISSTMLAVISGCVGSGAAVEFKTYCKVYKTLPTIEEIKSNPEDVILKEEPSHMFAYSTLLSKHFVESPAQLIKFINRLPKEFQVICLRGIVSLDNSALLLDQIQRWISENGDILY